MSWARKGEARLWRTQTLGRKVSTCEENEQPLNFSRLEKSLIKVLPTQWWQVGLEVMVMENDREMPFFENRLCRVLWWSSG